MDAQCIEQLLYYQRHFLSGYEQHERSDWRAMAADTHRPFSDTTLCAYTEACIYVTIWSVTTHDNKTHIPYD